MPFTSFKNCRLPEQLIHIGYYSLPDIPDISDQTWQPQQLPAKSQGVFSPRRKDDSILTTSHPSELWTLESDRIESDMTKIGSDDSDSWMDSSCGVSFRSFTTLNNGWMALNGVDWKSSRLSDIHHQYKHYDERWKLCTSKRQEMICMLKVSSSHHVIQVNHAKRHSAELWQCLGYNLYRNRVPILGLCRTCYNRF